MRTRMRSISCKISALFFGEGSCAKTSAGRRQKRTRRMRVRSRPQFLERISLPAGEGARPLVLDESFNVVNGSQNDRATRDDESHSEHPFQHLHSELD